jgi:hypothetical protein
VRGVGQACRVAASGRRSEKLNNGGKFRVSDRDRDAEPQPAAGEESLEVPPAAESDLQLDRALEILKSWSYFER